MMQDKDQTPSPNSRLKKPSRLSIFSSNHHGSSPKEATSSPSGKSPSPKKSPTAWIRSKAPDFPEIKDKYKRLTSRMGSQRRHSGGHSTDFSYDPQSYSLNFEENDDEENPYRSFTSRLPSSPPRNRTNSSPTTSTAGMRADQAQNMSLEESFQRTSLKDY